MQNLQNLPGFEMVPSAHQLGHMTSPTGHRLMAIAKSTDLHCSPIIAEHYTSACVSSQCICLQQPCREETHFLGPFPPLHLPPVAALKAMPMTPLPLEATPLNMSLVSMPMPLVPPGMRLAPYHSRAATCRATASTMMK